MKENALRKIYNHPDRDELISKLTLEINPTEINKWLVEKYSSVGDKSLIISAKLLKQFKDEYLDLYHNMKADIASLYEQPQELKKEVETEVKSLVQTNSIYRQKLEEYVDKELDIKNLVKNLVVAIEFRAAQVFDAIQASSGGAGKMDYVLINYMNSLVNVLEKYDAIINGGTDKIIQQNNINIQILDKHISVFQNVIREVISRLDYNTSLLFIEILNEELNKLKPIVDNAGHAPIDVRLNEIKDIEQRFNDTIQV